MGLFQVVHTITLTLPHHLTSDELQELEELTFAHFLAREGTDPRTSTIKHADWPITLKTVTSQHLVHPGGSGPSNSSASSTRASPKGPRARTSSRGSTATSKSSNGQAAKAPSPVPTKVPSVAAAEEVPVRPASRAPSAVPSAAPKEKTAVPSLVVSGGRPSSHVSLIGGSAAGSKAPSRAPTVVPSKPTSAAAAPSKTGTVVPDRPDPVRPASRAPSAAAAAVAEKPSSVAHEVEAPAGDKPLPHPPSAGDSRPPSVAPSNALGLRFSPLQPQAASVATGEVAAAGQGSRAGSRAGSVVGDVPPKVSSVKDDTGSVVAGRGEGGSKVLSPIKEAVTPAPPPAPTPVPAPAPSAHGSVPIPKAASAAASKVATEVKVPSAAGISRQPSIVKIAQGGQPHSVAASVAAHESRPPSVRAASAASAHGSKGPSAPAAPVAEGTIVPKSNKSVPAPPPSVPHTEVERSSPAVPTIKAPPADRRQSFPPGRQVIEEFTTLEISLKAEWGEDALGTARIKELVGVCLSELEMMARRLEQKKNAVDNAPMSAVP